MPFSKVKWVTIDVGGTLLFAHPSVGEIYAEVLARHGHQRAPEILEREFFRVWSTDVRRRVDQVTPASEKSRWRRVVLQTFADLDGQVDFDALFDDLWHAFREAGRWRLAAGAEETVRELRERGYRLAILSNWDDRLRPLLQEMTLDRHFDEIFVSCEEGFEKPDPRLFETVETRLGARGEEIAHIGDSHHHDVLGARSRGWRAIQVFGSVPADSDWIRVDTFPRLLDVLPGRCIDASAGER